MKADLPSVKTYEAGLITAPSNPPILPLGALVKPILGDRGMCQGCSPGLLMPFSWFRDSSHLPVSPQGRSGKELPGAFFTKVLTLLPDSSLMAQRPTSKYCHFGD